VSAESIRAAENPNQLNRHCAFRRLFRSGGTAAFQKANYSQHDFSSGKPFFSPMCFSLVNAAFTERTAIEGK
jgi:hypothetical protein